MKTRKRTLLWIALLFICVCSKTWAAAPPDLKLMSLTITEVYGNDFWLTYQVKNIGGSPLELHRLRIVTYASSNTILDATDVSAGITNIGPFAPVLAPGESYTKTINASSGSTSLEAKHFILAIVEVRPGYVSQETALVNNILVKDAKPSFTDLVVDNVTVTEINGRGFDYTYTIRNTGVAKLHLNKHFYKAYVSKGLNTGDDVQVSTGPLTNVYVMLSPGETYTGIGTVADAGADLTVFKRFLFQVHLETGQSDPEQSHTNDFFDRYIPPSFSDLKFSSVNVTHVNGKTFTYNFTVTNAGNSPVYIDRYNFNLFVSQNNTWEATDPSVGYLTVPSNQLLLLPGNIYTRYGTAVSPVELEVYPNFFIQAAVLPGKINPEWSIGNNTVSKSLPPYFTDLSVEDITVDNVHGNTIDYTYTIRNTGISTLYLERQYFQTYVSNNGSIDATDVLTGGDLFTSTPLALNPGESFTKSATTTAPSHVNLIYHRILILDARLLNGQSQPQNNHDNDRGARSIVNSLANLAVNNIEFIYPGTNSLYYTYYVSNIGKSKLYLDQFRIETYFSSDNTLDIFDIPAGEANFETSEPLITNAYYSHNLLSIANVNRADYPYLIFLVKPKPGEIAYDIDQFNSRYIIYAPPAIPTASLAKSASYEVTRTDGEVNLENISNKSEYSDYVLYNLAGEKISEGHFEQKTKITTQGFTSGIYVLKITNGEVQETIKLFIGQ